MAKGKYTDADLAPSSQMGKYSDVDLAVDFTGGPNNTEGTYQMVGHDGKAIGVAYSQVKAASDSGYKMHPTDRLKYVKDSAADPNLKNQSPTPGVKVVGKNSAGQDIFAPETTTQRAFVGSTWDALKQGVKGFGAFVNPTPTPEEKERSKSSTLGYLYDNAVPGMYLAERMAEGQIGEAAKAGEELKKSAPISLHPTDEQLRHRQLALGHGLASVVPGVGPWAAQTGEKMGEQVATGDSGGAAGTFIGNAILYAAPHLRGPAGSLLAKAYTSFPESVRTGIRDTIGVTDKAEDLIDHFAKESEKVRKDNEEANNKYVKGKAEAEHKTQGEELAHEQEVGKQKTVLEEAHKKAVDDTNNFNQRVTAKYQEKVKAAQETNSKIDQQIQDHNTLEKSIADDTRKAFDADEQERIDAKKKENDAWAAWRAKAGQFRDSAGVLVQAIEKWGVKAAEISKLLSQIKEDPASLSGVSTYSLARQAVIDKLPISNNTPGSVTYDILASANRDLVDAEMKRLGIQPPSASINLQPDGTVTLDELHRAKSVLRRHEFELRRAGKLVEAGEANQLADIFEDFEAQWSKKAGVFNEWLDARKETVAYNKAFGREYNDPRTTLSETEKQTNPDYIKEQESEERLKEIEKRNPQLAAEHRRIRAERERLAKMDKPDSLEKKREEIPTPPTVNDLRDGFRLKPPPTPVDTEAQARAKVKEPERDLGPDRPQEIPLPDGTTIPIETAKSINRGLRRYGKIGGWVLRSMVGGEALHLMHGSLSVFGSTMLLGQTAVTILSDALRKPSVVAWLAKPTAEEIKMIDSLPPQDAARLRQALVVLASDELSRNVAKMPDTLNPTVAKFILGAGVAQQSKKKTIEQIRKDAAELQNNSGSPSAIVNSSPAAQQDKKTPSLEEMKKKAADLHDQMYKSGLSPKPPDAAPTPQPAAQPAYTHTYDPDTGQIVAVQ